MNEKGNKQTRQIDPFMSSPKWINNERSRISHIQLIDNRSQKATLKGCEKKE
jgi:hypothetical protein